MNNIYLSYSTHTLAIRYGEVTEPESARRSLLVGSEMVDDLEVGRFMTSDYERYTLAQSKVGEAMSCFNQLEE